MNVLVGLQGVNVVLRVLNATALLVSFLDLRKTARWVLPRGTYMKPLIKLYSWVIVPPFSCAVCLALEQKELAYRTSWRLLG